MPSTEARGRIAGVALFAISLFVMSVILGCTPNSRAELCGTYVAQYDVAREKLTLNEDGTFVQEVAFKSASKTDIAKGRWTYDSRAGYITFHENFMLVLDGFKKFKPNYAHPEPGIVVMSVEEVLGSIRIGSDEVILYEKVG